MSGADHPLIRMLAGFEARVLELATALAQASPAFGAEGVDDAVEVGGAGEAGGAPARASGPRALALRIAAVRQLWFSAQVPLDAFLHPGNRIAILSPDPLRRVLAARALIRCQDDVRRCIDRDRRRAIALAVGDGALAQLQDRPAATACGDSLPEELEPDLLARRGWQMMLSDGACGNATLGNIVELSLARIAGGEWWERMLRPGADRTMLGSGASRAGVETPRPRESETSRFFSIAGDLFPEFQWLFG